MEALHLQVSYIITSKLCNEHHHKHVALLDSTRLTLTYCYEQIIQVLASYVCIRTYS